MNNLNDRVLCRVGARLLTAVEAEFVSAAAAKANTLVCTVHSTASHTGPDGDGCGHDTDLDFA